MNQDITNQLIGGSNCIPQSWLCPQPYTIPQGVTLTVEKLPGGFIVTANGRREIVATAEALSAYLQKWGASG